MLSSSFFLTLAFFIDSHATQFPDASLKAVGSAQYRFGPLKLYKATLKTQDGYYSETENFDLTLLYYRGIPAEKIANASIIEMARLSKTSTQVFEYLRPSLISCFNDVEKKDEITGRKLSADKTVFYLNGQKACEIDQPNFSNDFFAIWLAPDGRYPKKTAQLTGLYKK